MTSLWDNPVFLPENSSQKRVMPFSHSYDWETNKSPILSQGTCVWVAEWQIELSGLTSKPTGSLLITKKTELSKHAPFKKVDRVQFVSFSMQVRHKIKKLHELLTWMRNGFYMVKCSHSGAWQAWVYVLVLPIGRRMISEYTINLNITKADNDMQGGKTVDIYVSCVRKWMLSHNY